MHLGIDASNLRAGGGVTHLVELLRASEPSRYGFEQVTVWSGATTLRQIEDRHWLRKVQEPMLDRRLSWRIYWQRVILNRVALSERCRLLFVPGGKYTGKFRPFVTMSQNLLPFEWSKARRYGASWTLLRLAFLRQAQARTFCSADGVIFLTRYARDVIMDTAKQIRGQSSIIPHGINDSFMLPPRTQKDIGNYSLRNTFRILYVSIIDVYKHQRQVAEAVAKLREKGFPVQLDLVGPAYRPALRQLRRLLYMLDPSGSFIHYRGPVSYLELPRWYHQADAFVFASSCENMPNILLEAMASGLPTACSNHEPMREILGDNGVYFDPEEPDKIADALQTLLGDIDLRSRCAWGAYEKAKEFSWERCARETFTFLSHVAQEFYGNKA